MHKVLGMRLTSHGLFVNKTYTMIVVILRMNLIFVRILCLFLRPAFHWFSREESLGMRLATTVTYYCRV